MAWTYARSHPQANEWVTLWSTMVGISTHPANLSSETVGLEGPRGSAQLWMINGSMTIYGAVAMFSRRSRGYGRWMKP